MILTSLTKGCSSLRETYLPWREEGLAQHVDQCWVASSGGTWAKNTFFIVWNRWHMGNREDGADSLASQVKPASHWPGMRVLIAVVSGGNSKII